MSFQFFIESIKYIKVHSIQLIVVRLGSDEQKIIDILFLEQVKFYLIFIDFII